jgi:ketosteroid isomerase-like protein
MKAAEAFIKTAIVVALSVSFVVTLAIWRRSPVPVAAPTDGRAAIAAPTAVATTGTIDLEPAVAGVVNDWIAAIKNRDVARINDVLADEFSATLPDGGHTTKWLHIKDLQTRRYVVESLVISNVEARVIGDMAIVTYEQAEQSQTGRDVPYNGRTAWTDVLVNRAGRWQIVAEHGSQLPSWVD